MASRERYHKDRSGAPHPRILMAAALLVTAMMAASSGPATAIAPSTLAHLPQAPSESLADIIAAHLERSGARRDASDAIALAHLAIVPLGEHRESTPDTDPPGAQQTRNLDVAQRILGIEGKHDSTELAHLIAVAKAASAWQQRALSPASILDSEVPETEHHVRTLLDFAARNGHPPNDVPVEEILRLSATAPEAASAISRLIEAFWVLEVAADQAYAGVASSYLATEPMTPGVPSGTDQLPAENADASTFFRTAGVELQNVLNARAQFLDAVAQVQLSLPPPAPGSDAGCQGVQVPPLLSIELGACDTTYTDDFLFLFDQGGNDTYHNNAGGNGINATGCISVARAAALVDLAGDDAYGDPDAARRCGANGGGYLGLGVLVDAAGDDLYAAGDYGTNGGGQYGGIGLLLDGGGADTFGGGSHGTNGGGDQGAGMLLSGVGPTRYLADTSGANGGARTGAGFLYDAGGDDLYRATCCGANGGAYMGGAGFLFDGGGNDLFSAPVLILGGILGSLDPLGAVNGGAMQGGAGFLLSVEGNDRYTARHAGANGGGHLGGFGLLIDGGGHDIYTADDYGTNGGGSLGRGMLVDVAGDDFYRAITQGANGGASTGNGILLDAGGADRYTDDKVPGGTCQDCSVPTKGQLGIQIDVPDR